MSTPTTKPAFDMGMLTPLLANPAIQQMLASALIPLIVAWFTKLISAQSAPPITPGPRHPEDEPINPPAPKPTPTPTAPTSLDGYTLTAKLVMAQFSAKLFPKEYTADNPFGLYPQEYLRKVESGDEALSRSSKFWCDLTLRDASGREIQGDELTARDLAFRARHVFTFDNGEVGYMQGNGNAGLGADEHPVSWVGWGGAKWATSHGMNLAAKAFGEGTVKFHGELGGIKSNTITVRVS